MPTVTRATLRTKAREMADMVNSQFVPDSVWNYWLEEEAQELWDLIIDQNEDYETISTTLAVSSGNTVDLPADFYKLRGVDVFSSGRYYPLKRFILQERGLYEGYQTTWTVGATVRYRIIKDQLHFLPEENAAGTYRVWYVPTMAAFDEDTDVFNGRNGWDQVIYLGAAIKALAKEESDTSKIQDLKDRAVQRVLKMLGARDLGEPDRIVDVRRMPLSEVI